MQARCHAVQTGNRRRQQHKVADKGGGGHAAGQRSREGFACVNERVTVGRRWQEGCNSWHRASVVSGVDGAAGDAVG